MSVRRLLLGLTLLFGATGLILSLFSFWLFYGSSSSLWQSLQYVGYGLVFGSGVCGVLLFALKRPHEVEPTPAVKPRGRDDLLS